jgi:hypothetical protein
MLHHLQLARQIHSELTGSVRHSGIDGDQA